MARALKVYRTPIGFHDAYVAARTKKAALEAWGSDKDLFARGAAEIVTDPALTAEPLARPGEVIRRLRGTEAEQIAALPPDPPAKARGKSRPSAKPRARSAPRPSRDALERAEAALAEADERHVRARREIAEREAALARERQALDDAHERKRTDLEHARDAAAQAYADAFNAWES
ncbi:hypothetical protein [Sphingomonas jatrophae]|uniref:Cell envelope biogenesis protein TolA n=1 Tax=Sphingomonas jatrophae TaxID=1166337 RepID=A0A1I6JNN9_9SPHN|nr:hypothetical protein [Sphingomonas jatrophae]SFR80567.1 hypothetical protein SAMN05192580_0592 [Sphingomonas jatrophae]